MASADPENWKPVDNHDELDALDRGSNATEGTREMIRNMIEGARSKGFGNLPGSFKEWMALQLTPPKASWKRKLKSAVSHELADFKPNGDRVWNRPSRREYIPMKMASSKPVYIWVDASGSVYNNKDFASFFAEIEAIAKAHSNGKVFVGQWDMSVTVEPKLYRKGAFKKVEVAGGGGTDPSCIFNWIEKNKVKDCLNVILTDGQFSFGYDAKGAKKVLWAVFGNKDADPSNNRTTGETINID
jgi:predicted metal-dependent peptidase